VNAVSLRKHSDEMEDIAAKLGDQKVDEILLVCGKQQRKRKRKLNHLTPEYHNRLKTAAMKELIWMATGVPEKYMTHLVSLSSVLPQMFGLKPQVCLSEANVMENPTTPEHLYVPTPIVQMVLIFTVIAVFLMASIMHLYFIPGRKLHY
jgi:hypothetical protein